MHCIYCKRKNVLCFKVRCFSFFVYEKKCKGGNKVKKHLYDYLCHTFTDSARRELMLIKEEYPMLSEDIRKWTYHGKSMSDYEVLRQQYVSQIRQTVGTHRKQELRIEATQLLMHAGRWYAFQFLFEEAYKERFAKEVVINMLRYGKFTVEDIEQILPYVDKEKILSIQDKIKSGVIDWEVITNG